MTISNISPFIRFAETIVFPRQPVTYRACDNHLYCIKSGTGSVTVKGRRYALMEGSVVFVPAGDEYFFESDIKIMAHSINFDFTGLHSDIKAPMFPKEADKFDFSLITEREVFSDCTVLNAPFVSVASYEAICELDNAVKEFELKKHFYTEIASSRLKLSLIEILRSFASGEKGNKKVLSIEEYIKEHCTEALSNAAVANHFGYHPYHLNRLLKSVRGKTVHEYLLLCRINNAKDLLAKSDMAISDICLVSGFRDAAGFSREFKKQVGMTPGEYRKKSRIML